MMNHSLPSEAGRPKANPCYIYLISLVAATGGFLFGDTYRHENH